MNPFDLRGPEFLLFYLLVSMAAILLLRWLRQRHEGGSPPAVDATDPYFVACLRGGRDEATRVAVMSLIDRGLITVDGTQLSSVTPDASELVSRPIEKAVLKWLHVPEEAATVMTSPDVTAATYRYEEQLAGAGLIPDEATKQQRAGRFTIAAGSLVLLSVIKILVALSRGRHNVGFLVVLTIAAVAGAAIVTFRKRTARGDEALRGLRETFRPLKDRAQSIKPGGATNEMVLLMGLFGLATVPTSLMWLVESLYPRSRKSSSWTGSCGSSCGSSCGGGGCGGGGCGGCGG